MDKIKLIDCKKDYLSDENRKIILGKIEGISITLGRLNNQINQIILVYIRSFYPSLLDGIKNIPYYFTEWEVKRFEKAILNLVTTDLFIKKIEHIKKQTESLGSCFFVKGFAIQHLNDNNLPIFDYGFPDPNSLHSDKDLFKCFLKKSYVGNFYLMRKWSERYLNLLNIEDENEISMKKGGNNCFSFGGAGASATSGDLLCWRYWNENINYGKVHGLSVYSGSLYFKGGGFVCKSDDIIVSLAPRASDYFRQIQKQNGFFSILCDDGWVYDDKRYDNFDKDYECLVSLKMNSIFADKFLSIAPKLAMK